MVQERRTGEDRRKLSGQFLALLAGALPEDRRKAERRRGEIRSAHPAETGRIDTLPRRFDEGP